MSENQAYLFHSNYSLVISTMTKYFKRFQDVISDLQRFFKFQCSLSKWIMRCYLILIVVLTFFLFYSYFCSTSWVLLNESRGGKIIIILRVILLFCATFIVKKIVHYLDTSCSLYCSAGFEFPILSYKWIKN